MKAKLPSILLFSVLAFFIAGSPACRHKKEITTVKNDSLGDSTNINPNCRLDFKSAKTLTSLLKKNEFNFKTITCKFDASVIYEGKTTDFNVSFRGKKDSVMWLSITDPLLGAVEGARAILTCDSVRFMDRLNKQYFVGTYDTLRKMMNIDDLDFEMLQALLMGNSVEFYEEDEKLKPGVDRRDCKYLLGTIRKRKIRRMINGKPLKDPAQSIWLDADKFKILRIFFTDLNTNRTFDANYETFEPVDSLLFPRKVSFEIKAEHNMLIKMRYSKVGINKELSYPFSIPSSYERIPRKKKD